MTTTMGFCCVGYNTGPKNEKPTQYLKNEVYQHKQKLTCGLEVTRQQIIDLPGLTVETAIKSIKQLEAQGEIKIIAWKIWI